MPPTGFLKIIGSTVHCNKNFQILLGRGVRMSERKSLKRIWDEINDSKEEIEKDKTLIYNSILREMRDKKRSYKIPVSEILNVKEIQQWLKSEHDLTSVIKTVTLGFNPSLSFPDKEEEEEILIVSW